MTEKLLIPAEAAATMLSMGRSTFYREVSKGNVPAPIKVGTLKRWRVDDLRRFVQPANQPTSPSTRAAG